MTQALVSTRSQKKTSDQSSSAAQSQPTASTGTTPKELLDETDALLDEIDEVLEVEVKATETLTLADLIRNGAKQHPQAFGAWTTPQGETCALSAALDGAKSLGLV
jgi:Pup-like protein